MKNEVEKMAKVTKATREIVDVDKEIEKVTSAKKKEKSQKTDGKKKPSKKQNSKKVEKKEKGGILKFFKEVKKEISKVQWPSRKDMVKYSIATISFIIFFAIFFYIIEIIMALLKAWV